MSTQRYEQIGVAMTCRSYEEYVRMFDLTEAVLKEGRVLDVAAGGSSFIAEANARGYSAIAVDPRYDADVLQWIEEATEEITTSTAKLAKLEGSFDWSYYGSLEGHRAGRERSISLFKEHVLSREGSSSYVYGKLPELPFPDHHFSLVLCSHFMFLYANQFGPEFHIQAIKELMRICKPNGEIRIYPLISLNWEPYPELEQLLEGIRMDGGTAELLPSHLPFIPTSDRYLRILL